MEDNKQPVGEESNSLENLEESSTSEPKVTKATDSQPAKSRGLSGKVKGLINKLNVYFLLFILIVIVGLIILFISWQAGQQPETTTIETQELTQEAVDALIGSDAVVGDPKQLLTVESDSVFTGKVLIRDGLDVAGAIKVGGSLSLPGITVSGTSAFDEVTLNQLSVSGDVNVQGQLSIQEGLTVSGPVTFSGTFSAAQFAIQSLTVEQDLVINRHIDAGGSTPGVSGGGATGSGGTVTLSGTDTAGTVTVNVGSGASAGALATVTFRNAFTGVPHVIITPVASQGSSIITGTQKFYLSSRTSTGFTIATSGALPSGSVSFDYFAID